MQSRWSRTWLQVIYIDANIRLLEIPQLKTQVCGALAPWPWNNGLALLLGYPVPSTCTRLGAGHNVGWDLIFFHFIARERAVVYAGEE